MALVGSDPELASDAQWIKDVAWFDLADKANDGQVSLVLGRLRWPSDTAVKLARTCGYAVRCALQPKALAFTVI